MSLEVQITLYILLGSTVLGAILILSTRMTLAELSQEVSRLRGELRMLREVIPEHIKNFREYQEYVHVLRKLTPKSRIGVALEGIIHDGEILSQEQVLGRIQLLKRRGRKK